MLLLDAVNEILPKLGEHRVTGLTIKHPTLDIILPEIDAQKRNLLTKGWWFNEFVYEALRDMEGHIFMSGDVIRFVPDSEPAVMRDGQLYNATTRSYVWTTNVTGVITENVAFESLPENAAVSVMYNALVACYVQDLGTDATASAWTGLAQGAQSDLMAEHLRQRKHTTRNSRRYRRIRSALRG